MRGVDSKRNKTPNASVEIPPWSFASSLWTMHWGTSCCSLEFASAMAPRYDWERLGAPPCTVPEEADLLLVSGPVNAKMLPELKAVYDRMRAPKYVISLGSCANTGGMFALDPTLIPGGIDQTIPVDIFIPGCPPRPEAIMHALLRLRERILRERQVPAAEVRA